jgi:hypothetical protein
MNRILFLFEEYAECISYLGECGQPCTHGCHLLIVIN